MGEILHIDIETYSPVDLIKCGVYRYAEEVEVMLFAYAMNDEPVRIIDLASDEDIPGHIVNAIVDPKVTKAAYNAQFERVCLTYDFWSNLRPVTFLDPRQWHCVMVHGLYLGLPGNLAMLAKVLGADEQKDPVGKQLINYFCKPCKPTKTNGERTRNLPHHDPYKWDQFKYYCIQDVETERSVHKKIAKHAIPDSERKLYVLDQEINDRGVRVDKQLIKQAIACDAAHKERTMAEAMSLTGLENPASISQLKTWLLIAEGIDAPSLNKESMPGFLAATNGTIANRVLNLRQQMSKTSVAKYAAMEKSICADGRIRGLLQFYGANRTGRWAGRLVQVQNLPQNHLSCLDATRSLLLGGDLDLMEVFFDDIQEVLSQLIRTAFIPADGNRFIVTDFSAIEARVIAWLADEKWRLDVFNSHGKIYEASAAQMFRVPIESITKASPLRQKGKVAELALGYQGAAGALLKMGAIKMGLLESELPDLVRTWREANPAIVALWKTVEDAATEAVVNQTRVPVAHGVEFIFDHNILFAKLPSGRRLAYVRPVMQEDGKFSRMSLTYQGMNQTTKQWERTPTYGGKLVENLVQAIARDCLAVALTRLDTAGYRTVMHVHDEGVLEEPIGKGSLEAVNKLISEPISWAPGLPLRADGFEAEFYKKE